MDRILLLQRLYAIAALALSGGLVYWLYEVFVWPPARVALALAAVDPSGAPQQTLFTALAGHEQQGCFTLLGWAIALGALQWVQQQHVLRWLKRPPLTLPTGMRVMVDDAHGYERQLETMSLLQRSAPPARALVEALRRFRATGDIRATAAAINDTCDAESERLDADLSMLRYVVWAIPSIGFIGTVRGISAALGQAHLALAGDISGVTASLSLAFNSTLVALAISIGLMFALYQLQAQQDRMMLKVRQFCENELLNRLQTD